MQESKDLKGNTTRLNGRLNQPFDTVNTVTGDKGIKQAQDEYQRLMNINHRNLRGNECLVKNNIYLCIRITLLLDRLNMEEKLNDVQGTNSVTNNRNNKDNDNVNTAEKTLDILATILLVIGCLVGALGVFGLVKTIGDDFVRDADLVGPFSLFLVGFFSIVSSIALKVLCNISNSLKDISKKMK